MTMEAETGVAQLKARTVREQIPIGLSHPVHGDVLGRPQTLRHTHPIQGDSRGLDATLGRTGAGFQKSSWGPAGTNFEKDHLP